jgi:hypothetical protein
MNDWLVRHITLLGIPFQNWMVVTLMLILIASLINLGEKRYRRISCRLPCRNHCSLGSSTPFSTASTHSRTRGPVACSLGRLTRAASRRSVCDRRLGELKAGAARQAANGIAPRRKSNGLLDISNPSKRRSTDHEIVAPSLWKYR